MGEFERPLEVRKDGVFLFVVSRLVPEMFGIDVVGCGIVEVGAQSRE